MYNKSATKLLSRLLFVLNYNSMGDFANLDGILPESNESTRTNIEVFFSTTTAMRIVKVTTHAAQSPSAVTRDTTSAANSHPHGSYR